MPIAEIAAAGGLYWTHQWGMRPEGSLRALAVSSWRDALADFLDFYAFERQGSSPRYRGAARHAVEAYDREQPGDDLAERLWSAFLDSLGSERNRANPDRNPLNPEHGDSIAHLVIRLAESDFNLIKWAEAELRAGRAATLSEALQNVRGIGPKIAAFFLRDVAADFDIDERLLEPPEHVLPIDVWTRRGAEKLAQLNGEDSPTNDAACAALLHRAALAAGVRAADLNVGMWILGAVILRGEEMFNRAFDNPTFIAGLVELERRHWLWRGNRRRAEET